MSVSDINDEGDIPKIAEMLYHLYPLEGLYFTVNSLLRTLDSIDSLFPDASVENKLEMGHVLKMEIIAKFCHFAENLGALIISFNDSYSNAQEEHIGLFNTLGNYQPSEVIDLYEKIETQDMDYIAKFVGYPPLEIQDDYTRKILENSCFIVKEKITQIARSYLDLRILYNAYKHGYRIVFGKDQNSNSSFVFLDKHNKQKMMILDDSKFDEIKLSIKYVRNLMSSILKNHVAREDFEKEGKRPNKVENIQIWLRKGEPKHDPMKTNLLYTSRGEQLKIDEEIGDRIYEKYKKDLEKNHLGKLVGIDIDEEKVIGIAESIEEIRKILHESGTSGKKRIRKIGADPKTGMKKW